MQNLRKAARELVELNDRIEREQDLLSETYDAWQHHGTAIEQLKAEREGKQAEILRLAAELGNGEE